MDVTLKGIKEVEENLVSLGAVAGEKVMRSVLYAATKPIADAARANIDAIPEGSGALAKAIRRVYTKAPGAAMRGTRFNVAVAPKAKDRVAVAIANLHYKRKRPIRGVFWGHLVEWTHKTRGASSVPGTGIFRRSLDSQSTRAAEIFRREIERRSVRALKKQNAAE